MKEIINIVLLLLLLSCNNQQSYKCEWVEEDSLTRLTGTIHLDTNGTIVFDNVVNRGEWERKINLIPCSENLRQYIFKTYHSYLYLKNLDDNFWVAVDGKFITSDTLKEPQKFLFNFVALIEEP